MRWAVLVVTSAALLDAQDARIAQGEKVFAANCSVPYCHGANGGPGRAPQLAGHSLTASQLTNTVTNGRADRGMPSFAGVVPAGDLEAVIAYVMSLRGSGSAMPARTAAKDSPGKLLFFDAVRMGGCGRCHELERRGSPVASPLKNIPADLRGVEAGSSVTVSAPGETAFPGIIVERSDKRVRVYDLSSPLPVLRTFAPESVRVTAGSGWKHRDAIATYSDAELREIARYIQSAVPK